MLKLILPEKSCNLQNNQQQGQVGIIIVLIMIVLLTIGVSLASRSIRQEQTALEQEQSTRVFNSAETAVEKALNDIFSSGEGEFNDVTQNIGDAEYTINSEDQFQMRVEKNSSIQIPLDSPSGANDVNISWHTDSGIDCSDNPGPAGIIVMIINQVGSDYTARYEAYDPCYATRGNDFEDDAGPIEAGYQYGQNIDLRLNDQVIRIMPVYSDTELFIASNDIDNAQYTIEARAKEQESSDADIARSIDVNRTMSAAPAFMDFALISHGLAVGN